MGAAGAGAARLGGRDRPSRPTRGASSRDRLGDSRRSAAQGPRARQHRPRRAAAAASTEGPITFYAGFDPTAESLHIGNLVPLLLLRRFQLHGHHPLALAGGATGMIGDPGGRSEERNLLDAATLDRHLAGIKVQLRRLLDFDVAANPARLVDNRDWTEPVGVLDFLRDVGKHVTVNQMLAKESVRARVASDAGISFTEFSYMLLQANDFWWLNEHEGCEMQVGGSDQWGNITAGHRPDPEAVRTGGVRPHRAAADPGRRAEVRQERGRCGLARRRADVAVRVPPVLRERRRPRRRALPAADDASRRGRDRLGGGRAPASPRAAAARSGPWPGS